MRAEYVKEWMETYYQVFPEKEAKEDYVEKMLKYLPGIGRLECSKEFQDGQVCYRYKVSGKKALSSVYTALPIKEEQIRGLLLQTIAVLEDAKECLLAEEDFVLEPSYIFVTLPQFTLEFCYVPGYGEEFGRQVEGLFEYLLNRVDYEDKAAVELLYDCYTICMKQKGGFAPLKKRLEKKETDLLEQTPSKQTSSAGYVQAKAKEKVQEKPIPAIFQKPPGQSLEQQSYISWIRDKLMPWRKKKEPEEVPDLNQWKEEDSRTVLLAARNIKNQPRLVHEQTGEVILLTRLPFYLGSGKEYVSHTVAREGVSRLHFCIQKRGERYILSDLNSTNGTYINGKEVLPGTEWELTAEDRIRAASEEFLFIMDE